jgi:Uma2 family endonuclease
VTESRSGRRAESGAGAKRTPVHQVARATDGVPLTPGDLRGAIPASALAGVVAARLMVRLGRHVEEAKIGICGSGGSAFRLDPTLTYLHVPSVWFVRRARLPADGVLRTVWPGAPDVAVEVLSEPDELKAAQDRADEYLENGSRLVWILDAQRRRGSVHRLSFPPKPLRDDDTLDGLDAIPGFAVRISELFP